MGPFSCRKTHQVDADILVGGGFGGCGAAYHCRNRGAWSDEAEIKRLWGRCRHQPGSLSHSPLSCRGPAVCGCRMPWCVSALGQA